MKDGEYTVRQVKAGKVKNELILKGVPKNESILTEKKRLRKGSIINVRDSKLISVVAY